jgi:hypothetical protein
MSTMEHYQQKRNANLFISNNANPYLISPYSPTQISQTTGNNVLKADILKAYSLNGTIQVESPMNCQDLFLRNNLMYTSKIYEGTTSLECTQLLGPPLITAKFGTQECMFITPAETLFTNDSNDYFVEVNGQFGQATTIDAGPKTLQGYVPFKVNGGQYYLPVYQ